MINYFQNNFTILYLAFLISMGALFIGHEIGIVNGQELEKKKRYYDFCDVPRAFSNRGLSYE